VVHRYFAKEILEVKIVKAGNIFSVFNPRKPLDLAFCATSIQIAGHAATIFCVFSCRLFPCSMCQLGISWESQDHEHIERRGIESSPCCFAYALT
jgi:hypothetical protein